MKPLRSWFRPAKPATYQRMDPQEARVASAWGHTEQTWLALTDQQRATLRRDYLQAPRYTP